MPSSTDRHRTEVPEYLWQALVRAAKARKVPTNILIAEWLWQALRLHADDPLLDAGWQRDVPKPYDRDMGGWMVYPRRDNWGGGPGGAAISEGKPRECAHEWEGEEQHQMRCLKCDTQFEAQW